MGESLNLSPYPTFVKGKGMNRTCKKCGLDKPIDDFPVGKGNKDGRRPLCKPCYSKYTYAVRNTIVCARASKKYSATPHGKKGQQEASRRNAPKRAIATEAWRATHKEHIAAYDHEANLEYNYQLTKSEYDQKTEEQNNSCAVCHKPNPKGKRLAVDHDHSCCPGRRSCGKCVRGLLCSTCNSGLGQFKDSPELLQSAIEYLNSFKHKICIVA